MLSRSRDRKKTADPVGTRGQAVAIFPLVFYRGSTGEALKLLKI